MKNERLKKYRDLVRDAMKLFDEFSIEVIPREYNHVADALDVSASTLQPCKGNIQDLWKCKWYLYLRSLTAYNIGKSLMMIMRYSDSCKVVNNYLTPK